MSASHDAPVLYVAADLRAKFPLCFLSGVGLGLLQLILWDKSHPMTPTLVDKLLSDQIAMTTIFCLSIFCFLLGGLFYRFRNRIFHQKAASIMEPLVKWLTQLASIGANVICGVGLVALFTGAARHGLLIVLFVLYLVGMMEISNGLWRREGLSKTSPYFLSILMCAPFIAPML